MPALRTAQRLRAGTVWINTWNVFDAALPFGGYKQSDWGREMGHAALDNYLETKTVWQLPELCLVPLDSGDNTLVATLQVCRQALEPHETIDSEHGSCLMIYAACSRISTWTSRRGRVGR